MKRLLVSFALASLGAGQQAPSELPSFDAAVVKPGSHPHTPEGYSWSDAKMEGPGRFRAINANLHECLQWAYGLKDYQMDEPDWAKSNSVTFDIEATAPADTSNAQMRLMLRRLLVERLGVVSHQETRNLPVYILTTGKGGPKLKASAETAAKGIGSKGSQAIIRLNSAGTTMSRLAAALTASLDRPVLDKTDLTGIYVLDIAFERLNSPDDSVASVFTAIQELGLRLEPVQAPVEILKVDRANTTPTPN